MARGTWRYETWWRKPSEFVEVVLEDFDPAIEDAFEAIMAAVDEREIVVPEDADLDDYNLAEEEDYQRAYAAEVRPPLPQWDPEDVNK